MVLDIAVSQAGVLQVVVVCDGWLSVVGMLKVGVPAQKLTLVGAQEAVAASEATG